MKPPTERFSTRVANYARHRPGYPAAMLDHLLRVCGLGTDSIVADLGSGTGLLAAQLLARGWQVIGVEPNREMREAAEAQLAAHPRYRSVAAPAEATTLERESVDLIVAAQAFHWFDRARARLEFVRILKPPRWTAIAWNYRHVDTSAFLRGYEALLHEYCPEYAEILDPERHRREVEAFFGGEVALDRFDNVQSFDWEGLAGRHLSQSYVPLDGPRFEPMMRDLRHLYDACQVDGRVAFEHETRLYLGKLRP
jgi:SAM-dependent methyltransferase